MAYDQTILRRVSTMMYVSVVSISELLSKDVIISLEVSNVMSQSGISFLIVSLHLTVGLKMVCGSRRVYDF